IMHTRILLVVFGALPPTATGARAQTQTLKIKDFASPGKRTAVTESATTRRFITLSQGGMVLNEIKKGEVERNQYPENILEGGDERPKKYTRTYAKATKGEKGSPAAHFRQGKTFVYELQGDKYKVTVQGGDAKDPEAMKELENL